MSDEILKEELPEESVRVPGTAEAPAPVKKKKAKPELVGNIIVTILLTLGAIIMLYPFAWMILATIKPSNEINTTFFPSKLDFSGYATMWTEMDRLMGRPAETGFVRGFLSSILTTVPVVVVQIIVSAFAAYAFAKLKFFGKNVVFLILLGTMMIPFSVIMMPQSYWYGSVLHIKVGPLAVILPKFFGSIGTVFFLRQFFYSIPDSITEAARLDGAGYTRTFLSVLLPLVMPAIATQAILSFIGNWNDFLGPLLYIGDREWLTLPLLINRLQGSGSGGDETLSATLAASLISLIPIVIVFAAFQKKIVGSIVFSAVKG